MYSFAQALVAHYLPKVVDFEDERVVEIVLRRAGGDVRLRRERSGDWVALEPRRERASRGRIDALLSSLRRLTAVRVIDGNALARPDEQLTLSVVLTLSGPCPTTLEVAFGEAGAGAPVVPCVVSGRPETFLVPRYLLYDVDKDLGALCDRRVVVLDPADVDSLSVRRGESALDFRRTRGIWRSDAFAGDGGPFVEACLERLRGLRVLSSAAGDAAATIYAPALERPALELAIGFASAEACVLAFAMVASPRGREVIFRNAADSEVFPVEADGFGRLLALIGSADRASLEAAASAFAARALPPPIEASEATAADIDVTAASRVPVSYELDRRIFDEISCSEATVREILTSLKAGRNVILYGAPGVGKTKLISLLCDALCGDVVLPDGRVEPNYTIATANAEWGGSEVIGGLAPVIDAKTRLLTYRFQNGIVTRGAIECARSLLRRGRPYYVVIDEFNRANIDECFGRLLTIFEYRTKQPLLSPEEAGGRALYLVPQFRLIGTMNVEDKNTLFAVGYALMRRFSFIEVGLPDADDERRRLPWFVAQRLQLQGMISAEELAEIRAAGEARPEAPYPFPRDHDGSLAAAYEKLMRFMEREEVPAEADRVARGVRTFKAIGPALVIDCLLNVIAGPDGDGGARSLEEAVAARSSVLQDALIANVLPQFQGLYKFQLINLQLKAAEVFGEESRVAKALEAVIRSPGLSIFG